MTTAETAEFLDVTDSRIRQFYGKGRLKGTKIAGVIFFHRRDVESFANVPRLSGGAGHGVGKMQST